MAKYTMELRQVIQLYNEEFNDIMETYPLFNEAYRSELNKNIINNLFLREIGYETPEIFLMKLRNWFDLSMPYYNQLYKANEEVLKLTPTQRVKIVEFMESQDNRSRDEQVIGNDNSQRDTKTDANNSSNSNRTSKGKNNENYNEKRNDTSKAKDLSVDSSSGENKSFHSDFPQSIINPEYNESGEKIGGGLGVGNSAYYTYGDESKNINDSKSESESEGITSSFQDGDRSSLSENEDNSSGSSISKTDVDEKISKKYEEGRKSNEFNLGSKKSEKLGNVDYTDFELIEMFRKAFVSVDKRLINALKKELFLQVW